VLAAQMVGASQAVIVAHHDVRGILGQAAAERRRARLDRVRVTVRTAADRFVAGQASAVASGTVRLARRASRRARSRPARSVAGAAVSARLRVSRAKLIRAQIAKPTMGSQSGDPVALLEQHRETGLENTRHNHQDQAIALPPARGLQRGVCPPVGPDGAGSAGGGTAGSLARSYQSRFAAIRRQSSAHLLTPDARQAHGPVAGTKSHCRQDLSAAPRIRRSLCPRELVRGRRLSR
jgi:hypothetical protein